MRTADATSTVRFLGRLFRKALGWSMFFPRRCRTTIVLVCSLGLVRDIGLAALLGIVAGCQPPQDEQAGGDKAIAETEDETYRMARERMIEGQLVARNIKNERVLKAMREVPRHLFVPQSQQDRAYEDSPLPIGFGQTISQPYIVAFMTEILDPKPTDKVLEIGTGSGYQAAVLAKLVAEVYSVEIIDDLAQRAQKTLTALGFENVHARSGDGYEGWPEHAPFDAVIVTCAPDKVPQPLVDQLADGGKMIIPVGRATGSQELFLLQKSSGELRQRAVLPVRFVPMTGAR